MCFLVIAVAIQEVTRLLILSIKWNEVHTLGKDGIEIVLVLYFGVLLFLVFTTHRILIIQIDV